MIWHSKLFKLNSCHKIYILQLSIIIVNYNVKYFLEQCLCSVIKASANIVAEIIVVDNNSSDGSRAFFANRFPQVTFIWKTVNVGFAKANNEALKQAKGEKVLFLNPDTILPEDCLEKCLSFFQQQNKIGALGIRMIDGAGNFLPESKRGFPSFFTSFCKMTGLAALFPQSKIFARYYMGHLPENENNEVDVLSGAFMMVDKKVLDKVGSFDEDYFMYAEDIDLSYRIQKAGYKNFYFAQSTIIHFKGESVSRQSADYIRNFYGTMIQFIQKHYSGITKPLYILLLKILIFLKKIFTTNKAQQAPVQKEVVFILQTNLPAAIKTLLEKHFSTSAIIQKTEEAPVNSAVLFCEPATSFAEIVAIMQQHKNRFLFFIHAANTKGIVGSGDKTQQGDVYGQE